MYIDTAVIFAGGKSRRMGEDKSLLPFGGFETLAEYQYEKLKKLFKYVYFSVKNRKFDFTDDLIVDSSKNHAPTYGLTEVLNQLNKPFFALGVDIPFVKEETIRTLCEKRVHDVITIENSGKLEPLCSVYYPTIKDNIIHAIEKNNHKLTDIIKRANSFVIEKNDSEEFMNLNDRESFTKALKLMV